MKIAPKKSLGQNFLVNPGIVEKIVAAAELSDTDTVLEVGPGTGILTRALAATGARIVAVEKDRRVIEYLNAEFSAAQIEIIEGDILKFDPDSQTLLEGEYKIVANLPYYITSHFIRTVFEKWPRPISLVIMVQKEVAQRMMAKPPDMNLLALSVQYYASIELVANVSKGSFRPEPTVDSAVVKLVPCESTPLADEKQKLLFEIFKKVFGGKRKQLMSTLPAAIPNKSKEEIKTILEQQEIDPQARPETVDIKQWVRLINSLY